MILFNLLGIYLIKTKGTEVFKVQKDACSLRTAGEDITLVDSETDVINIDFESLPEPSFYFNLNTIPSMTSYLSAGHPWSLRRQTAQLLLKLAYAGKEVRIRLILADLFL